MERYIFCIALGCCLSTMGLAQTDTANNHGDFPIIISLQFHAFTLPFRDLKANFSNIGIGLGTEVSLNQKGNWVQQLSAVWYHNKAMGNGLLFYSQLVWRPMLGSNVYSEAKLGVGYLISSRPVKSYKQVEGEWVSAGHRGKGMFTVPVGVSLGYSNYSSGAYVSPFASYQFLLVSGYNKSIPIVPETLVQVGSRVHFK